MSTDELVTVYSQGLVYASVCAPADMDPNELERIVNMQAPTGVGSPWRISSESFADGTPNPAPCAHADGAEGDDERRHWLLSC
jgi:hypothetical protein